MRKQVYWVCLIGLMGLMSLSGAAVAALPSVKYDSQTNLVTIDADRQSLIILLHQVANIAQFTLIADQRAQSLNRIISINLIQVPLGRAINLMLGNINRVVTYSSEAGHDKQVEAVEIISSDSVSFSRVGDENDFFRDSSRVFRSELPRKRMDSLVKLETLKWKLKQKLTDRQQQSHYQKKQAEETLLAHIERIQKSLMGDDEAALSESEDVRLRLLSGRAFVSD